MADAHLRVTISSRKKSSAEKTLRQLQKLIEIEILDFAPYHKGGFELNATMNLPTSPWPEMVLSTLTHAQRFGYAWALTGFIAESLELTCDRFKIQGIEYAGLHLDRPEVF